MPSAAAVAAAGKDQASDPGPAVRGVAVRKPCALVRQNEGERASDADRETLHVSVAFNLLTKKMSLLTIFRKGYRDNNWQSPDTCLALPLKVNSQKQEEGKPEVPTLDHFPEPGSSVAL